MKRGTDDVLSVLDAARWAPDAIAIVDRGRALRYAEVAEEARRRIERLPAATRSSSARPQVGLVAHNDASTLFWIYALIEARVPFVILHPNVPDGVREHQAVSLGLTWTIDRELERLDPDGGGAILHANEPNAEEATLAVVLTSGSEGAPRGVVLSRRAWRAAAAAHARHLGWRPDDRWLLSMPLAHVAGLGIVLRCLSARRPVVTLPPGPFVAQSVASTIVEERVTLVSMVPTMLQRWLDDETVNGKHALRAILLGGAPASASLLERAAARGLPLRQTYGMSETCGQVVTASEPTPHRCVGEPLNGVELQIDDGEILVRAPMLFSGYYPPSDGSLERGDEHLEKGGYFRTGDLGTIDEHGRLHVLGRKKLLIITGGENVSPEAVEEALMQLDGIKAACAFGVPDEQWGELVAAAVVLCEGKTLVLETLRDFCRERLPGFARPKAVAILDELPLGATGKVDRTSVARRALPSLRRLEP